MTLRLRKIDRVVWLTSLVFTLMLIGSNRITTATAEEMESSSYRIQFGNFNMTSGEKSSASYTISDTVGQTFAQDFASTGYQVLAGFQYIYPFSTFTFSLSSLTINLGDLTYGAFNTASHTLTVSSNGAGGYVVQTQAAHPLALPSGSAEIPDTTCNSSSCDEQTAGIWTDPSQAGFGFSVQGDDVSADFVSASYFRQFADRSLGESSQTIMSGNGIAADRSAIVTYQAAPAGNQASGRYETTITYRAIPTY